MTTILKELRSALNFDRETEFVYIENNPNLDNIYLFEIFEDLQIYGVSNSEQKPSIKLLGTIKDERENYLPTINETFINSSQLSSIKKFLNKANKKWRR